MGVAAVIRAACLGLVVAAGVSACGGDPPSRAATAKAAASVPASVTSADGGGADGGGARVAVSAQRAVSRSGAGALVVRTTASASAKVLVRLPAATPLGSPRVLLVQQVMPGWVRVVLPMRPNGSSGWVAASAVRVETTHDQVSVDLVARRMTVVLGGVRVASVTVGVGSTANPTPTGEFFVTDRVRPADPGGAYGAFALGLSAHSTTLSEFGNGDGQVGIHGTNVPTSVGQAVSHGCIRVDQDAIATLARVPLGTPVVIR